MKSEKPNTTAHEKPLALSMKNRILATGAALALLPLTASAHVGEHAPVQGVADSFVSAFIHPFTGTDHLAAMLAVGAFSSLTAHPAGRLPAVFAAALIAGALAGMGGVWTMAVEPMIATSVLLFGLLIALQKQIPWAVATALSAVFAVFHGLAHGHELAGDTRLLSFAALAGMAMGSAVLLAAGVALGRAVKQRPHGLARWAGAGTALLGAFMLARLA
jgi:urease accessory protein